MDTITVEVKPHHLKNNSFQHRRGVDNKRNCPLDEALREAGYSPHYVGAFMVQGLNDIDYNIDTDVWILDTVDQYIQKANEGSQESVFVNLHKIP